MALTAEYPGRGGLWRWAQACGVVCGRGRGRAHVRCMRSRICDLPVLRCTVRLGADEYDGHGQCVPTPRTQHIAKVAVHTYG